MYHERTIYTFKAIDPSKKFSQFMYYDANFEHVNIGDCEKGMILKIGGQYYLYAGDKSRLVSDPSIKSTIQFKNRKQLVKEIIA